MSDFITILDLFAGILMLGDLTIHPTKYKRIDKKLRRILQFLKVDSYSVVTAIALALALSLGIIAWGLIKDIRGDRFGVYQLAMHALVLLGGVLIGVILTPVSRALLSRLSSKGDVITAAFTMIVSAAALFSALLVVGPSLPGYLLVGLSFGALCMLVFLELLSYLGTLAKPRAKPVIRIGLGIFIFARILALYYF